MSCSMCERNTVSVGEKFLTRLSFVGEHSCRSLRACSEQSVLCRSDELVVQHIPYLLIVKIRFSGGVAMLWDVS